MGQPAGLAGIGRSDLQLDLDFSLLRCRGRHREFLEVELEEEPVVIKTRVREQVGSTSVDVACVPTNQWLGIRAPILAALPPEAREALHRREHPGVLDGCVGG